MKAYDRHIVVVLAALLFLLSGSLYAQNSDRDLFLDAEARFQGGSYVLALEQYEELIRKWPQSAYYADAWFRRAVILYRMGKTQEAYLAFETIERRYRSTKYLSYIPFWKALIDYDRGDYRKAFQGLSTLSLNNFDEWTSQQVLLYKGKTALALEDTDQALQAFETLYQDLIQVPHKAETQGVVLVYLSDLYSRMGKQKEQSQLWESLSKDDMRQDIREPLALRAAEAYLSLQNDDKAIPLLESLSASSNREIAGKALQYLLSYEQKRGNDTGVASVIIKAENLLRTDPQALASFWTKVGSATFYEGKLDLARSYLLRAQVILGPRDIDQDVPIYLAEINWRQGDAQGAIKMLQEAESRITGDKALLLSRLQWYALQGEDWDNAVLYGQKALAQAEREKRDDIASLVRAYIAYGLYRKGQFTEALETLGTDTVPPGPKDLAKRLQSRLLQKTGQSLASLESYNALLQQTPHNPELEIERMSLLFEKAQYTQVLAARQEIELKTDLSKLSVPYRFGFMYMQGIAMAQNASTPEAYRAAAELLVRASELAPAGESTQPWAVYYAAWSLYRAGRFAEAADLFNTFVSRFPAHGQTYAAAYLGAWSYARLGQYANGARLARRAAELNAAPDAAARAWYLDGLLRSLSADWSGALRSMDQAGAAHPSYAARAAFEKGNIYFRMGNIREADAAFAAVQRNFGQDPLAEEAAYRRGELYYGAKQWKDALERFTAYRNTYPRGSKVDGALYFSGSIQQELSQPDSAILLWERLLREYSASSFRLPTMIALEKAYWVKQDWENALRVATNAIVEFGETTKGAGLEEEVAMLRYLIAGMSEKAARLQVQLVKQQGVSTPGGRKTALDLARYYILETSQREAGAVLADQIIAYRGEDPGSASEAYYLKGEYFGLLEAWDKSAAAYLEAVELAATLKPEQIRSGQIRQDLIPESLFKAARSTQRLGRTEDVRQLVATLSKQYPASPWTRQAERLLEAHR